MIQAIGTLIGSRWARFFRQTSGASSVELAVFLGVVVGAAAFGADFMGVAVRQIFTSAANPLGGDVHVAEAVSHGKPIAAVEAEPPTPANLDWIPFAQLAAGGVVLVCGAILWYRMYATRVAKELAEDKAQTEAEIQLRDKLFAKRQSIMKFLNNDMKAIAQNTMSVRHLMSRKLTVIPAEMPYEEVKRLMYEGRRHHLLVAKGTTLLGVISDRDVARKSAPTAGDLMTKDPYSVTSTTLVGPAITMLLDRHISCLPVVDDGELVGVLTKSDLLMALQCTLQVLNTIAQGGPPAEQTEQKEAALATAS